MLDNEGMCVRAREGRREGAVRGRGRRAKSDIEGGCGAVVCGTWRQAHDGAKVGQNLGHRHRRRLHDIREREVSVREQRWGRQVCTVRLGRLITWTSMRTMPPPGAPHSHRQRTRTSTAPWGRSRSLSRAETAPACRERCVAHMLCRMSATCRDACTETEGGQITGGGGVRRGTDHKGARKESARSRRQMTETHLQPSTSTPYALNGYGARTASMWTLVADDDGDVN